MSRFFEILPGALAWLTLILVVVLSSQAPAFVAVFIILFDIYWLLKSLYLSFHLRSTFREMKKNLGVDWLRKLKEEERDANAANTMRMPRIVEKELSYRLNGVLFRVHNQLGRFARERQYGDVLAQELERERIPFLREAALEIAGRKSNFADFLVDGKIAVELKAKSFVDKEDYYQIQRYLQTANLKLGLIVNFRERHLKAHRVLNADTEEKTQFADSHVFEDSHRGISWREIHHLVILPMYQEPHALVRESFLSLIRSNYPKDKMVVVLATEERAYTRESGVGSGEWGVAETARRIQAEFGNEFLRLLVTVHPAGLPGELAGKGSNETWAAKEAKRLIIDPLLERDANAANTMRMPRITGGASPDSFVDSHALVDSDRVNLSYDKVLVSVFDVDTQVYPEYFGRLTYAFLRAPDRLRAVYQPIPLFVNNIFQAPALARIVAFTTSFWQMMQQSRPERLTTFSSQSVPFPVLKDIGFWHTDAVSEDSRIFWQGFLRYHGEFRVEPLFYPVSMDANVTPRFWQTMKNLYKQHRRWGWGAENIPYMLEGFRQDKKIPLRKKWYWGFHTIEGFHSWATNALMIFALGWLPIWIGGDAFNDTLLSYNLPRLTSWIIDISMIGIATSAIVSILLLPPKPEWFRPRHYLLYLLQWALLPVTLIIFGALPGLEAQTRLMLGGRWRLGFWVTPKHRIQNPESRI